jgi:hypothetical protein
VEYSIPVVSSNPTVLFPTVLTASHSDVFIIRTIIIYPSTPLESEVKCVDEGLGVQVVVEVSRKTSEYRGTALIRNNAPP